MVAYSFPDPAEAHLALRDERQFKFILLILSSFQSHENTTYQCVEYKNFRMTLEQTKAYCSNRPCMRIGLGL